ncbi:hypothetical protein HQ32_04311 [Prauserella sp. Am3]|nr:hypothetical protein HQ32_04311 [Prauserella sp. Am3]
MAVTSVPLSAARSSISCGTRPTTTVSQPSPTTSNSGAAAAPWPSGRPVSSAARSVTFVPSGGVNSNSRSGCGPNRISEKPTSNAGSVVPWVSTDMRSGSRSSASTATRTSRSSVRSSGFGVSTSSYAARPATLAVPSTDTSEVSFSRSTTWVAA